MGLHLRTPQTGMVLQLPFGSGECVPNGDMGVLVGLVVRPGPVDDDAPARNVQFDGNPEQPALVLMPVRRLDDDPAGDDPVEQSFEMDNAAPYIGADGVRYGHVTKFDLRRDLHEPFSVRTPHTFTRTGTHAF